MIMVLQSRYFIRVHDVDKDIQGNVSYPNFSYPNTSIIRTPLRSSAHNFYRDKMYKKLQSSTKN